MPNSATAPAAQMSSAVATSPRRCRKVNAGSAAVKRSYKPPAATLAVPVGVRSASCNAGKRVNATTQEMARPTAVQMPNSRIGRTFEMESAAKPSTAASAEVVTGRNLFRRAASWCTRTGTSGGRSTKRECRYTSDASVVTRTVSGTSTETMVKVKPSSPPAATPSATAEASASKKARSVRTER